MLSAERPADNPIFPSQRHQPQHPSGILRPANRSQPIKSLSFAPSVLCSPIRHVRLRPCPGLRSGDIVLRTPTRGVSSYRARAITLLAVALLATSARAQTVASEPRQEVNLHAGVIHHDEGNSIASHVLFGARVVGIRRGALGFGVAVDWWPERYGLGPTFDDRQVVGDYLAYAVEMELNFRGPLNGDLVLTSGLGAETVRFGDRYEAEAVFPKRSTSPAVSLGIGSRFPMTLDRALMLRLDLRARGAMAEVFDPTGVTSGRVPTFRSKCP